MNRSTSFVVRDIHVKQFYTSERVVKGHDKDLISFSLE